jgi:hypothetical protein
MTVIKKHLKKAIIYRRFVRMGFHFKYKQTMYIIDLINLIVYSLIASAVLLALHII